MTAREDMRVLLASSLTTLKIWCESKRLIPEPVAARFVKSPTWANANALASAAGSAIHYFVSILSEELPDQVASAHEVLHSQLGRVVIGGWLASATSPEISIGLGLAAEIRVWLDELKSTGCLSSEMDIQVLHPPMARIPRRIDPEAAYYVYSAALDQRAAEERDNAHRMRLERVRSALGLSSSELARLIGVSREAVRQWEQGGRIGKERWQEIDQLFSAVNRLATFFKPDALPALVRRTNAALNHQTPLEWLTNGRSQELLKHYERVFSYETTG